MELNGTDSTSLELQKSSYKRKIHAASLTAYVLAKMNELDFQSSIIGINYIYALQDPGEITIYQKLPKDLSKMMALRLCSEVSREVYANNVPKALELAKTASLVCLYYIDSTDVHTL